MYGGWDWKPYVSAAERRRKALKTMESLRKRGQSVSPVVIEGRTIAKTFWGKAWCGNLEQYSDFANRLPRGRTYVRNGSVIDLQIAPGKIKAKVSGSAIYTVDLKVVPVDKARWRSICTDCSGSIDSLVELLQGQLSKGVMERICRQETGLFPSPAEIKLSCSCPDWADMCKHAAAVLYGVGVRLDRQPELLFRLHGVDEKELIANATGKPPLTKQKPAQGKVLGSGEDLSALFGLELARSAPAKSESKSKPRVTAAKTTEKSPAKKGAKKR
jgi:uncharacterized Zn finger protein